MNTLLPRQSELDRPAPSWLPGFARLLLCAAYLQGGFVKAWDFGGAAAEMTHFGLLPAKPLAAIVIVLELGASALVLSGRGRWIGALALALFTLSATFVANRFWDAPPADRGMLANGFFEHLGLVGGFLLVVCDDFCGGSRRSDKT
jgi:uncharacterized membrane protein YphA (DoxX/SURF4 family)